MSTPQPPTPILALCDAATLQACLDCEKAMETWSRVESRMSARGNFGVVRVPMDCKAHINRREKSCAAKKEIIARLSPEVVRKTYQALRIAKFDLFNNQHTSEKLTQIYDEAIALLDGHNPDSKMKPDDTNPTPSKEAMDAAKEARIIHAVASHPPEERTVPDSEVAAMIDRHFAPLRDRLAKMEADRTNDIARARDEMRMKQEAKYEPVIAEKNAEVQRAVKVIGETYDKLAAVERERDELKRAITTIYHSND